MVRVNRVESSKMSRFLCTYCRRILPHCRSAVLPVSRRPEVPHPFSTEAVAPLPPPPADSAAKIYSDKIRSLVADISQLSLLETAQLNELLKTTLNIPDAPMMTMGSMPAAASAEGEKEEEVLQTEFTVKLVRFEDGAKIKVIKEVKMLMEGMNLVEAKKFVEGVPQVVKKDVTKEEAERLQAALEAAGGIVELE